jgi:hypothetical protein
MSTKAIYTGYGFVTETDSVQYVQLSDFASVLSGVSVAAAAAGDKNLRPGKHYVLPAAGLTGLSVEKRLSSTLSVNSSASLASLHDGKARFAATLTVESRVPRAALVTNYSAASTPTYRNTGTAGIANNGNVTPGNPTRSAGDLLLAVGFVRHAGTLAASAGWTSVALTRLGSGLGYPLTYVWRRTATNDANDNLTLTLSGGSAGDTVIGVIHSFYGHNTGTPVDNGTWEDPLFTVSDPMRHPSSGTATVDDNDRLFIWWGADDDATTIGTPTITAGGINTSDEAAFSFTLHNNITTTTGSDATLATASAVNPRDYQIAFQADIAWQNTAAVDETWGTLVINGSTATVVNVHLAGAPAAESSASLALTVATSHKDLDGTLAAVASASLNLFRGPNRALAGTLAAESTASLNLFRGPDRALAGTLADVVSATLSTIATGTRQARLTWVQLRFPLPRNDKDCAGTLTCSASATAGIMATGERHLAGTLTNTASAALDLRVGRLSATLVSQSGALLWRLTTGRNHYPAAMLQTRASATAALFVGGLKGTLRSQWRLVGWLNRVGQKDIAGTVTVENTGVAGVEVERSFRAQILSLASASATLDAIREVSGVLGAQASGQLALTSDRHLFAAVAADVSAELSLQLRPKLTATLGCATTITAALDTDPGLRARLLAVATAQAQVATARQMAVAAISRASARCALSIYRAPESVAQDMYVASRPMRNLAVPLDKPKATGAVSVEEEQYETT